MAMASTIWHVERLNIEIYIGLALLAPLLITLWLLLFNSGSSKVTEYGFSIDDDGFTFIRYGEKQHINWANYEGYKLTRSVPKYVEIKNNQGQNISFSFYTFSSEQRNLLFETLNNKSR